MDTKVYWLSRHALSKGQLAAIRDLHGDAEIVTESIVYTESETLADHIRSRSDGFVYAVAPVTHCIEAALAGLRFGWFENHPGKRQNGEFGLAAVYHVDGTLSKVWSNPDPESDKGETLAPVSR
jgi:hypothetical protein